MLLVFSTRGDQQVDFPVYCIHLSSEKERRKNIERYFKNVYFFDAIDTRNDRWLLYSHFLTDKAIGQLYESEATKLRRRHYELSPGAVGCFLSHIFLYKMLLKKENEIFLILEDDSTPISDFSRQLKIILNNIPQNTDIYLLNYHIVGDPTPYGDCYRLNKENRFYLTNCYLITKTGMEKILTHLDLIEWQIDSWLSLLNRMGLLNIYCSKKKICPQSNVLRSTIQIYDAPFDIL